MRNIKIRKSADRSPGLKLRRRDFLKLAGGISAYLPFFNCFSAAAAGVDSIKNNWTPGIEHWAPVLCQGCPGGCGLLARLIDDRIVKVEGNSFHPLNRGKVCPRGQAVLQLLYNPDRIRSPLKKVGGRDSGNWEVTTWEDAYAIVSSRMIELRNSGKSHTLVFMGHDSRNTSDDLVARFLEAYGTPNYIKFDPGLLSIRLIN